MNNHQGFTLVEVLISLFLISTTSLGLLSQQLQASQLHNQTRVRVSAFIELDNNSERLLAGTSPRIVAKPFVLQVKQHAATIQLSITWPLTETLSSQLSQQVVKV